MHIYCTKNLKLLRGLHSSQRVLVALVEKAGLTREEAYKIVQENAMKIWENQTEKTFLQLLIDDAKVADKLGKDKLKELFDDSYHLKNIDVIFGKVFGSYL